MKIDPSVRKWFIIGNLLLLVSLAGIAWRDEKREWKKYQKRFNQLEAQRLEKMLASTSDETERAQIQSDLRAKKHAGYEVKQLILNDLERVDRCITCHVGMDPLANPSMQTEHAENPYKGHPQEVLKGHPVDKFGCTACHSGQGLATTMEAAHGNVKHWEEPMLEPPFIQGSCAKCHANFEQLEYTKDAALGKQLVETRGCRGCHTVKGFGGVIGDDLSEIASKPLSRIDFSSTGLPHEERNVKNWIYLHLTKDPMEMTPGDPFNHRGGGPIAPSGMQPFYKEFSEQEAKAVTAYLMSMTSEKIPHDYYVYAAPKPEPYYASAAQRGRHVFVKYGCVACHGPSGEGGRRNFNAIGPDQNSDAEDLIVEMAKGQPPALTKTVGTYTREELSEKIEDGVPPNAIAKFKEDGPTPPLYMPAWGDKIKGQEMEDLLTYLFSIAEKTESW